MATSLFDRLWESHVVREEPGEPALLYVDLHLVHEVTSPQAFEGLRLAGPARPPARPDRGDDGPQRADAATSADPDPLAKAQLDALSRNCAEFGVPLHATGSGREGIVHVIGPELGLTQPGLTIVCGDSHTSTHGAFGALAFGIGTSEVEHVLATQTLPQRRPRSLRVDFAGALPAGRDREGPDPRRDRPARRRRRRRLRGRVRRRGDRGALDGGPHDHLQHVDRGRRPRRDDRARRHDVRLPRGPPGRAEGRRVGGGARPLARPPIRPGRVLRRDRRDRRLRRSSRRSPGARTPAWSCRSTGRVPDPADYADPDERAAAERALEYMALEPGTPIREIASTASSSARARTRGSRTCVPRPGSSPAGALRPACARWSSRAPRP